MEGLIIGGFSIYYLLALILTIVWILLPFAIFGTKKRLNQIVEETSETNILLEEILAEIVGHDRISGDEQSLRVLRRPKAQ